MTWSLGLSLGFVDMIGSAELLARHLRAALELGDERRIARGLALEAAHVALQERSPSSRAHTLLSRAHALASKQDDPALSGLVALSQSATAFSEQRLRDTRDYAARAHAEFARHPGALLWERSNARYLEGVALAYLGDFAPLRVLSAEHLTQARERGDRYGITNFVLSIGYWIDLIDDAPDAAEDAIRALLRGWSQTGYHYQHFAALLSLATIDLYRGGSAAERRIERDFRGLEASLLLRVRSLAMLMGFLRGRAYVASALEALGPRKREQLQKARGQVKRILSSKVPASAGYATCLRGTIALAEGREEHALALLRSAEAVMNAYDIGMYRDAIRIGIGTLEGGDEGKARSLSARDALSTMGVRNVANYVRMVLPGLPCSEG